jgi:hypothetical protein
MMEVIPQACSDEELAEWAKYRADDAGRLARELIQYRSKETQKYFIGEDTLARVFKANDIVNLSDLQVVFSAVEVALKDDPRWQTLRELFGLPPVANPDMIITHIQHIHQEWANLLLHAVKEGE